MTREINKILCPIDLSPESEATLKQALTFARIFQAKLFVCYCAAELSSKVSSKKACQLNEFAKNVVDFFVSGKTEATKIEWESVIIESNNVSLGIIEAAQSYGTDLIIINSNHHPWLHQLLCSVAEDICRSAPCSVLVVQPSKSRDEKTPVKRILAAHDFSDYSELALQNAITLAQKFKAELHLLHVINEEARRETELAWAVGTGNYLYHQTTERLQKSVFNKNHISAQIKTSIRWGKPYREILAYSKEQNIDLITVGAHGADFGMETLFGSNVDRILRQTPCAVLVARPFKPVL